MCRNFLIVLLVACVPSLLFGDGGAKKKLLAKRIDQPVRVDGILSDEGWLDAMVATDFVQLVPTPGKQATHPTEVRILYDHHAVYIGAVMHVADRSQVSGQIFERDKIDEEVQSDWFAVAFDTYMDGINGSAFIVGPSESQADIKFSSEGDDASWDAVWEAKVTILDRSWTVEMKIPYAALRFPDADVQAWHIQFGRRTFYLNEEAFWNEIDPAENGFLNQSGVLEGIRDIQSPVRLSATPFLAYYVENQYDRDEVPNSSWGSSLNGGMDVKYGISDAFTLDMTLIPDFGQVRSDNQVLNLSPFEIRFDENRQFFTEGVELFNKAGLFYSRRVGGVPLYYDEVEDQLRDGEEIRVNPATSRLYNATKISGRTRNGTGLGFFNAIGGRTYATITMLEGDSRQVLTSPAANYNVLVLDQNLKNNSYLSLVNTNVMREGAAPDANVTGTEFHLRDGSNAYYVEGSAAFSQRFLEDRSDTGYKLRLEVGEQKGKWQWELGMNIESDGYDPNDLGFILNNNKKSLSGTIRFNQYEAFGPWLRMGAGVHGRVATLYRFPGNSAEQYRNNLFTETGFRAWWRGTLKNFLRLRLSTYFQPVEEYNYFEPRTDGRFYVQVPFHFVNFHIGTDNRKKFSVDGRIGGYVTGQEGRNGISAEVSPGLRLNDRFSLSADIEVSNQYADEGYVTDFGEDRIIFGRRDVRRLENVLSLNYAFSTNHTFNFRMRHNWTRVAYRSFHELRVDGCLDPSDYREDEDINFNAFTIDAVYRWRFAPGSDIFIVWKNAIMGEEGMSDISFGDNLSGLFRNPQVNSFSVKVLYYLDYLDVKKAFKGKKG